MLKKKTATLLIAISTFCLPPAVYSQNSDAKMKTYIDALMKKMTLEEKVGQLHLPSVGFDVTGPIVSKGVEENIRKGLVGGVFNTYTPNAVRKLQEMAVNESRLKIPLIFGYDVIHGHRTIFPISLGLSSSWDMDLVKRTARAAAEEASADGLNWTFSPMVDIARDPRWGRVSEGAGEDPFLGSAIAKAMVVGYQGTDLSLNNTLLACVKHFALYGASEAGRDYNTVDMSRIKMYNEYFPPYKAAINAGAGSVMTSFNEVEGIPASANKWLMTDVLRKQWNFNGLIVTDYTAINEMINHGMGDEKKVGELSLNAGVDMDMVGEVFLKHGVELVKSGKVSQAQIDAACRRILEAKYKLGLFQDPYKYVSEERNKSQILSQDKLDLSKEAAVKSMVLLKNSNEALPLKSNQKIAFIGPLVKDQRNLVGSWSGASDTYKNARSLWSALELRSDKSNFLYAKGCNLVDDSLIRNKLNPHGGDIIPDSKSPQQLIDEAVKTAQQADVVVAVLGEAFGMTGEAASRSSIGLLDNQVELLKALKKTGKPVVLVLMNGRPLTLEWEDKNMDAILETWFSGTMAGPAIASVLFGEQNPSGKLTMTFPRNVGQVPIYYNNKNTGRPFDENQKYTSKYLDAPNTPLYPFGYGLSYTSFSYGDIKLNTASMNPSQKITASMQVTNTGKVEGVETVQLYVRDMVGSVTRPVKELKAFQQVSLKPGESKMINFSISNEDLMFYNSDLKMISEAGDFKLFIGTNSRDVKEANFKLVK
ncbi:beta-glucosidase BglX [Daejeonella oryzae]|uniref:beta-glucosidase BglX n=1 Tax=Daejeonella oryzae TaxID=1122943 RepID=UPI0004103A96|nr:beta-glucosidase BglX [Daejeonella oryzae]